MKKDRFVAFFDAVMAIIMTIVVLEFVIPDGTDWDDLHTVWFQMIAYAVAFFWLGGMWINIHNLWHDLETINHGVLWVNIMMLFFSSMIPFFTVYVGRNMNELVPQLLFGIDVLLITLSNWLSLELLAKRHKQLKETMQPFRIILLIDILIKILGIAIGVAVMPVAIIFSVVLAMVFLMMARIIQERKKRKDYL